ASGAITPSSPTSASCWKRSDRKSVNIFWRAKPTAHRSIDRNARLPTSGRRARSTSGRSALSKTSTATTSSGSIIRSFLVRSKVTTFVSRWAAATAVSPTCLRWAASRRNPVIPTVAQPASRPRILGANGPSWSTTRPLACANFTKARSPPWANWWERLDWLTRATFGPCTSSNESRRARSRASRRFTRSSRTASSSPASVIHTIRNNGRWQTHSVSHRCRTCNLRRSGSSTDKIPEFIRLSDSSRSLTAVDGPEREESDMSARAHKGGSHHELAAEHHETAAHHHREAAKHYDAGDHEKAGHHAHVAHAHGLHA